MTDQTIRPPKQGASLFSLYLPAFIVALGTGLVVPALPILAKSFAVSFGVASFAMAVSLLGSAAATLPTGSLLDNVNRRSVTAAGPLLTALSCLLVTTAGSFTELILFQFLAGWGSQMWMLGRLTMLGDVAADGQLGRQITAMIGMESAGRLLGPAAGGFIVASWGPQAPFALQGALCILVALSVLWLGRGAPPPKRKAAGAGAPVPGLVRMVLTPPLSRLALVQVLMALTRGSLFSGVIDLYMVYFYGIGPKTLGLLRSFTGVLGLPFAFAAGHIMDRFGRKATLVPGFTLISAGFLLMALVAAAGLSLPWFVATFILVHVSTNLTAGSMQTLAIDVAPVAWRGRFLGTLRLGSECGSFVSSSGFAIAATVLGYPSAFALLSAVGASVAIVVAKSITETLRKN
jgi:MFS family permease